MFFVLSDVSSADNEDIPVCERYNPAETTKLMSLFDTWIHLPKFCVTAHSSDCRMAVKDVRQWLRQIPT